jgi:hypothetical protein
VAVAPRFLDATLDATLEPAQEAIWPCDHSEEEQEAEAEL